MVKQIYYEDIVPGYRLPDLVKHPTPRQLVMWAGASEDFTEIHYDRDYANNLGLPNLIVHGNLTAAFLVQLITDWMGDWGTFKKLTVRFQNMLLVNDEIICQGEVRRKYIENNEHFVECEVWAAKATGERCTMGSVLLTLPSQVNGVTLRSRRTT